jgi:hypothetical protein
MHILLVLFVSWKVVFLKLIFKFLCIYLSLEKLVNRKHFSVIKNFTWFSGKYFQEIVKNLEISYYLLITLNLIFKLLIAIYFVLNFFFQFYPLEFDFYINFDFYFYDCYLLFSYHFLNKIFYLSNLVLILLIVT